MVASARDTAVGEIEFVVYADDDPESVAVAQELNLKCIVGGLRTGGLAQLWNTCANLATGDLLMQANDDIVFRTSGWDRMVEAEFEKYPDLVLAVHGDDLKYAPRFGPHPIVHRVWFDTLGYLFPGCFAGNFTDTWINDVANAIGRRVALPFVVEHMHFLFDKAEYDETYCQRDVEELRGGWAARYAEMKPDRDRDAAKLRAVIARYAEAKAVSA